MFKRSLPFLLSALLFILVLIYIPAPDSWQSAAIWQIALFFTSLILLLTFFLNLILKKITRSLAVSLILILLIGVRSTKSQTLLISVITIPAVVILITFLKNIKKITFKKKPKDDIPKLKKLKNL
ncbi:MAG: hypothetical protein US86_C0002G0133 [Candidatus Daviesbacteria bacterium GW2011_GWA2_38_24]|uniref:Uncharacterized protein n=1 Tax=Candidatus Daviesbacteria bacterium GW2011_GWA2_38_24 TaxID=1618422 RepID=A0A0G0MPZ4_9BACT|nr:MAG: hypothetical protein US86_C0002G0133 [Candidatus Daviesbacteria bacterium GW2011_GWA2_38_24]KKQ79710.1 MAG: hypothetical protein UT01_C0030G0002 [Candidatus Daviesbacteria bacterium GW2011_GWA1_38_7]OGE22905.1 MAG: hypothetical protein A2688_04135 [Candidatus Daviesbacteria bacterium RIFCSPHIGHO2_01_FULL_38_8]